MANVVLSGGLALLLRYDYPSSVPDLVRAVAPAAGCGEGYLARILAARGVRVTGIDLSPRLIDLARCEPVASKG
jgi:SAM-dependent methyltransferase